MPARLHHLISRIGACLRPRALDRDFDQELESHLAMLVADYVRRGMAPEQARRAARLELGGHMQLREAHRAARPIRLAHGEPRPTLPWVSPIMHMSQLFRCPCFEIRRAFTIPRPTPG